MLTIQRYIVGKVGGCRASEIVNMELFFLRCFSVVINSFFLMHNFPAVTFVVIHV